MENEEITVSSGDVEVINTLDYSGHLDTIVELQAQQIYALEQIRVNQLFFIGVLSALFVCMVLYNAIKKFI